MKVKCPGCGATYNIDISKIPVIPEGGITTTCPKCKGKIPINLDSGPSEPEQMIQLITCPECGHVNISTDKCAGCGKVFSKEEIARLVIPLSNKA
jgi:DNA-directed RNA polymerase subunit RPC12/RpoP